MDVMEKQRLTEAQIENLALEIREFLLDHEIWQDVNIYFNHKRIGCQDPKTGKYFYNDRERLFVEEGVEPEKYFKYVNPDHILSMSFEGPVCHMIYYGMNLGLLREFNAIFEKYGLYYELGNHWNFSCYYI